jgi:hypothetical protein
MVEKSLCLRAHICHSDSRLRGSCSFDWSIDTYSADGIVDGCTFRSQAGRVPHTGRAYRRPIRVRWPGTLARTGRADVPLGASDGASGVMDQAGCSGRRILRQGCRPGSSRCRTRCPVSTCRGPGARRRGSEGPAVTGSVTSGTAPPLGRGPVVRPAVGVSGRWPGVRSGAGSWVHRWCPPRAAGQRRSWNGRLRREAGAGTACRPTRAYHPGRTTTPGVPGARPRPGRAPDRHRTLNASLALSRARGR